MKLACRLNNGDGVDIEYAIVELSPEYARDLIRMVREAKRIKEMDFSFCEIKFNDDAAQYGASLGDLENNLPEFGKGKQWNQRAQWIEVPNDFVWPENSRQSISASTVVATQGSVFWRALFAHADCEPYFETAEMKLEELLRLFLQEEAEYEEAEEKREEKDDEIDTCQEPKQYILYNHDMGDLATTTVYNDYEDAADDASRLDNVIVLPLAQREERYDCEEATEVTEGECVLSFPVFFDHEITDPETLGCAFDRLLRTAMTSPGVSSPGILEEYGNPTIGKIYLGSQDRRICDCEQPGHFCSGVPGILAHVENSQLAEGAKVERCDSCQRYPSGQAAYEKLVELGMVPNTNQYIQGYVQDYIQQGGGFCPTCRSEQIEGDSVDFDGPNCIQRMRCLDCDAEWSDIYVLSRTVAL